jgi:hypothetical protein
VLIDRKQLIKAGLGLVSIGTTVGYPAFVIEPLSEGLLREAGRVLKQGGLESGAIVGASKRIASFELGCEPNRRLERLVHGLDTLALRIVSV